MMSSQYIWAIAAAAAVLVADATLTPNAPGSPSELAHSTDVCDHRIVNNGTCSVFLDVPAACGGATSDCPLVLMYHGHGGHNTMFVARSPVHDFDFIGVYPQGANYNGKSGWNDGSFGPNCCPHGGGGDQCTWDQYDCTVDPNDSVWTVTIIAAVTKMGATGRWYAYGSSNGANEAQILAANAVVHPDVLPLVGIAVHSGQMLASPSRSAPAPYNYNQPCAGSQPCASGAVGTGMAQLSIHGTADGVINYHGGPRFQSKTFLLMDEQASNALWAKQNDCSGGVSNETGIPATYTGGVKTTATHTSWLGCPSKYPVELYTVFNSPHVGCQTIRGDNVFVTIFNFFAKVEVAHGGKPPPPRPPSPPPSPSPPPPSPPAPPEPAPPVGCQTCLLKACGFVRGDHSKCTTCIQNNRKGCSSACRPYPFAGSETWLCGPSPLPWTI